MANVKRWVTIAWRLFGRFLAALVIAVVIWGFVFGVADHEIGLPKILFPIGLFVGTTAAFLWLASDVVRTPFGHPPVRIHLICGRCGRSFDLGIDAIVTTWSGTLSQFQFEPVGLAGNAYDNPDLVDRLKDSALVEREAAKAEQIAKDIESGSPRRWRCRPCGFVQSYPSV